MTTVTTTMIKELRERTGVGMTKCKKALTEANGDIELAIANLRKAGMASAVKKQGRETNEGVVVFAESASHISFVEVNAETDFVVKNEKFGAFSQLVAEEAANGTPADVEALLALTSTKDPSMTVDGLRGELIQTIGENIQIRRLGTWEKGNNSSFGVYSHMGGKIVTAVEIQGATNEQELAKQIAMHSAAAGPEFLSPEEIPAETIEHEKEIGKSQMRGKPPEMIEKILDGKINKFYDEVCLLRQAYVRDESMSVGQLVEKQGKETGKSLKVVRFLRWEVGQKL